MKRKKDTLWNFRADNDLLARLNRASQATDLPAAHIVREAIKEKLDELAMKFPQIDTAPPQQVATTN